MNGAPLCELRIIRVTWAKKDHPLSVEAARDPIPVEHDGVGWVADITAYPVVASAGPGQLAVRLEPRSPSPVLLDADDQPMPMVEITAPDGREWWVEKGKWKPGKVGGYHDAPLCRHVGEARLRLGDTLIRLRVSAQGFDADEVQTLLDEFRNGAWQLILEPESPTRATDRRTDGGIDPDFLDAVAAFIRYAGRALDQPHRELREVSEPQRVERVRPHPGTFRELAVRGASRWVTGRGHAQSFNTPENRRLLSMCVRLGRTLRALMAGAEGAADDFDRRAKQATVRADQLRDNLGRAWVDARAVQRLILERSSDLSVHRQATQQLLRLSVDGQATHQIRLRIRSNVTFSYGEAGFWSEVESVNDYAQGSLQFRLVFDEDLKTLRTAFRKGHRYQLIGAFETICKLPSDPLLEKRIVRVLRLSRIVSGLEQAIEDEVNQLQNRLAALAREDFFTVLNVRDTDEQRRDIGEALTSAERFRAAGSIWSMVVEQLRPLVRELHLLVERARDIGIREHRGNAFTGSMTYVQNPDYRGALTAYRRALSSAGLRAMQLDGLLRLEDLGVLDLPRVYERWCLLRIVAVLRDHFHLTPPAGFRDDLLDAVIGDRSLSLRFEGPAIRRDLLLEYQPRLPREDRPESQWPRPDYMLTVLSRDARDLAGDPHPRLVLDAKCKPFHPLDEEGAGPSLIDELDELIARRRYREPDNNRVFVLHPGRGGATANQTSGYCHYGGDHIVAEVDARPAWGQEAPDHMHGAVLLRPAETDPLIRLVLMHLYLGLDDSLGAYEYRVPAFESICPACGGAEMTQEPPLGTPPSKNRGRARWCTQCGRMMVWNYSGGCGTHLWKLGGYWTFHETHPLNPYNIRCPHCDDYMRIADDEPVEDEPAEELWPW